MKIVIVGGGTSAWLAAAYFLNKTDHDIVIIDKERGSPIGVGEGTLLGFGKFLNECGFDKKEWYTEIDAIPKLGILFPNWGYQDNLVWHPFTMNYDVTENLSLMDIFRFEQEFDFNDYLPFFNLLSQNLINILQLSSYAEQVDCTKLVNFIKHKIQDKIKFIQSDVIETFFTEKKLKKVRCNNGDEIEGDFFIDCTGFKQLLIKDPKNINLEDNLFCNTAIASRITYENKEKEQHPYVISEAVEHGWIWNIPTQSRIGSGLVFNRNITDIDDAKKYFCKYWKNRITFDDCKVIDWTPYRLHNPWQGNVCAIGLSSGFIEPLESTGIGIITNQIEALYGNISFGFYNDGDQKLYNQYTENLYNDAVDFVSMHYMKNDIQSKFWNYVSNKYQHTEKTLFYLDTIKDNKSLRMEGQGYFFASVNWYCWLLQMPIEKNKKSYNHMKNKLDQIIDPKNQPNLTVPKFIEKMI